MKRIMCAALIASMNLLFAPLNCAVDCALIGGTGEEVVLYMNEMEIIPVNNPMRVVIANPKVADVANVTKKELTIIPKSPGTTRLVFWDNYGEQSCSITVYSENMHEIKRRIDSLLRSLDLPEVQTEAQNEEGKVILLGRVKTPEAKDRIALALGPLKDKTVDLIQVKEDESVIEIDVQVLELDKDATDTLGFTWPGSTGDISVMDSSAATTVAGRFQDLLTFNKWTRSALNLTWRLDFLIQEGKARILSRPRLACQSGKEAQLLVGGEKPVFTTTINETGSSSSSTVEYKEFGIKLKIKPNVMDKGRIKLNVNVEVSEVGTAEIIGSTSAPTGRAYPLTKRTAMTELFLNNGETMAIGGLIKQKTEEDLRKFPWLADVPVLGAFFKQRVIKQGGGTGERGNTELFITLTPTLIKSEEPAIKQAAAAPAAAPARPIDTKQELSGLAGYTHLVQQKISNAIYYPRQAESTGWEGNLKLGLKLAANGDLKEISLVQSSGYRVLDDTAIDVAQKQSPYPPFPPQVESQDLWVEVPILYKK